MSRAPLFDVMLVVQNNESTSLRLGNLELELEALETNSGKFDLSFVFDENSDGLFLHVEYNTDIFKKDRIERLFDHLETLVDSVSAHPHFAVDQLNILPETEKQRLLEEFNVGIGANTNTKSIGY
jgi:non-ribosomal peptide synthetase component F